MTTDTTTTLPPSPSSGTGRDSGVRTPLRILVIAVSLLMVGWGALTLASLLGRGSGQDSGTFDGVRTVVVDTSFEAVQIVGSQDASAVAMDRTYHWSFREPTIRTRQDGDVLRVSSSCTFEVGIGCTGRVNLVVPADVEIRVDTSDGSLTMSDLDGPVDVTTQDGSLHASDLTGRVSLRTSDGSIDATRLRSTEIDAVTSDGSVHLSFVVSPSTVTATTSDGSIDIAVPSDGTAYAVTATTSDGARDIALPTDPDSANRMDLKTSDGSIRVIDQPVTDGQ